MTIGAKVLFFDEIDSTNNYTLRAIGQGDMMNGEIVWAGHQTEGRGRRERTWYGRRGDALMMSFGIHPNYLPTAQAFSVSQWVAVSIIAAFDQIIDSESLKIKWPNDIYFGDQKLGGILIENQWRGQSISHSVIGIGLNVNQTIFSPDLPNPVSLKHITGMDWELEKILTLLKNALNKNYSLLKSERGRLQKIYEGRLFKKDQLVLVRQNEQLYSGFLTGVNQMGELRLESSEFGVMHFEHSQCQWVQ